LESAVALPALTKTEQQIVQLLEGRKHLAASRATNGQLFPQSIKSLIAFRWQEFEQRFDFVDDPRPFFGERVIVK
jgi:hypothetical protein